MRARPLPGLEGNFVPSIQKITFPVQFTSDAINALDFLDFVFGMAFLGVIPFTRYRPVPEGQSLRFLIVICLSLKNQCT
jgi:hypothetical protein